MKELKLEDLGYRVIVIDEKAIDLFLEKVSIDEVENFCNNGGRLYVLGNDAGELKNYVKKSGGRIIETSQKEILTDVTTLVRTKKHKFLDWSKTFGIDPKSVKSNILYVKYTQASVITDLPSFFNMSYEEYIKRKDCYLRLIAHGMENCPHSCIYCYANYAYDVPTTVLINFKNRIKEDIQRENIKKLIGQGYPINIGSITDPFSKVAVYFDLVEDFLSVVGDIRTLIVTKSILFTDDYFVNLLKKYKNVKLTFTYTGLQKYEGGVPRMGPDFPVEKISKVVSSGVDINIFYRPILKGINDDPNYMRELFIKMKEADITNVCFGFLRNNIRMAESLSKRFPSLFNELTRGLTDKYMDDFYPPLAYRIKKSLEIHNILYHLDMECSTCQPYIGKLRNLVETTFCSCRKERWEK
ncbi:MAG TPA: hypothetical protein ENI51_08185 [Candidatus Atribacteria bacterium]|nr:hypothetical protein [Candidatus Atribacteria bacterium]